MSKKNGGQPYFYSAYGMNIKSDIQLNDLIPAQSAEDVHIKLQELNDTYTEAELEDAVVFDREDCVVRVSKKAICYDWKDFGKVLVRNGNEVLIDPQAGVEREEFSPFITGAILAILLNQRGILVLHASAVAIHGEAVAFLGDKGAGKSTLAAFLQKRGHDLITDDLVPIIFGDDKVQTAPGYPRIKLRADSIKSVGLDWDTLPNVSKFIDKRSYQCFDGFSAKPVNLSRIYVLVEDSAIEISRLEPAEAFIEITRHTYLGRYLQATGQTAEHFQQCKAMISAVPIFSLKRPHDHKMLSEVASEIEKHS